MQTILNYIDGDLMAPIGLKYLDNFNPATGSVYAQIPDSDDQDVQKAYESAAQAFPKWRLSSLEERFKLLNAIAEQIDLHNEALAKAESIDQGKPCLLYTSPSPRDRQKSRMPSSA